MFFFYIFYSTKNIVEYLGGEINLVQIIDTPGTAFNIIVSVNSFSGDTLQFIL